MELVEQKFRNFKNFLIENVPEDNQHIKLITSSTLGIFLRTLKNYEKLNDDQLFTHIVEFTKLNISDFKEDVIGKFKRYLQYFRKVAESIV